MKLATRTALGVDISNKRVSIALLKGNSKGVEILKADSIAIPDGAIKNGNIEDVAGLAGAIKRLKARNKIRLVPAAVSLFAKPTLVQILDIAEQIPTSVNQFVRNEVRNYVALSGKEIALDFCRIGSGGRLGKAHLFVVATDGERVADIMRVCKLAGLDVDVIEPPLSACIRALFNERITGKFDCNVLIALLQDNALTLSVFKKQNLDFVRTKNIGGGELCEWLAEQINAVVQFYDLDVPDSPGKWEVTVVADEQRLPQDSQETLRAKVGCAELRVIRGANALRNLDCRQTSMPADEVGSVLKKERDTGLELSTAECPSTVATGLAMGLLGTKTSGIQINLLPPQALEVKAVKKQALLTATISAVVLLLIILVTGGVNFATNQINKDVAHVEQTQQPQNIRYLLRQRELLDKQIGRLSDRPDRLNQALAQRREVNWAELLNDIGSLTPEDVCITELSSGEKSTKMMLEGLALTYDAVHLFVRMLGESEHIDTASLAEAEKSKGNSDVIRYAINCSLNSREGK